MARRAIPVTMQSSLRVKSNFFIKIQITLWLVFFVMNVTLSYQRGDTIAESLIVALNRLITYSTIIYGNALWLLPSYYQKKRFGWYVFLGASLITLVTAVSLQVSVVSWTWINEGTEMVKNYKGLTFLDYFGALTSVILAFIFSVTYRYALDFNEIKKRQEILEKEHAEAQLNLLKAHLQPHFLFNTLNNIYSEAYQDSSRSAALIEQLSGIMRYFVDESPKDRVSVSTEIQFLEDYIALERVRVRYPLEIRFTKVVSPDEAIPPMLFMPLIENIFKHGIDRDKKQNRIAISMVKSDGALTFSTENKIQCAVGRSRAGSGLENLRKRLSLLYNDSASLSISINNELFKATLQLPI
jgi:sensor histidine kinase YesM